MADLTPDRARELLATKDGRRVLDEAVAWALDHRLWVSAYVTALPTDSFYWPACGEMIEALRPTQRAPELGWPALATALTLRCVANILLDGPRECTLRDALVLALAACGMLEEPSDAGS